MKKIFFQAEDGIRDAQESRGLGDVYKRQLNNLDHIELGDIFISLEMALEQSYEYKHSIYREMIWLASHGFLHLLGWEHNNEHDLENMLNFQEYLITRLD